MSSNKAGLLNGRFQPFHLGHLSAIKQALKQVHRLYIGIGSSQFDHRPENPFSAKERAYMIRLALEENSLESKCEIFEVPDIHDDDKWTAHVRSIVPPFDMVFIGNQGLVMKLFEKEGLSPVVEVKHEVNISATEIRKAINEDREWKKYLSPSVTEYLLNIDGIERIKTLQSPQ